MSGWTEFKDELNHAKANSPVALFLALVVDAILLAAFGIVNLTQGKTIGTMDANVSSIVWFVLAVVSAVAAYFMFKKTMIGYWIAMIAMIASLIIGGILCMKIVNNNVMFAIFPLLIGAGNTCLLYCDKISQFCQFLCLPVYSLRSI